MYHPTPRQAALAALQSLRRRRDELTEEIRIAERMLSEAQQRASQQPEAQRKRARG